MLLKNAGEKNIPHREREVRPCI